MRYGKKKEIVPTRGKGNGGRNKSKVKSNEQRRSMEEVASKGEIGGE